MTSLVLFSRKNRHTRLAERLSQYWSLSPDLFLPCVPAYGGCKSTNMQPCVGSIFRPTCPSHKKPGYCWSTPKCRNLGVQDAVFEGKKAEETAPRKSTPRTLKEEDQQYLGVIRVPEWKDSSAHARHERRLEAVRCSDLLAFPGSSNI
jgi:hypothetical protein